MFDPSKLSAEAKDEFSSRNFIFGPFEKSWLAARNTVPLLTETRTLDAVPINLFRSYPGDFPRRVFAGEAMRSPLSRLHLDRVRILRIRLPLGKGTGFALEWPQDKKKVSYCTAQNPDNSVIGVEFFGRLEPPFPLAADATVWSDGNSKALLSFPVVWSDDGRLISTVRQAAVASESRGQGWSYNMMNFSNSISPLPRLPGNIQDRTTSGRIDFVPSRSVALASQNLDKYFGERLSIPIPSLELMTIPGHWIQKDECPQDLPQPARK